MLKFYAWEKSFLNRIVRYRENELVKIKWANYISAFSSTCWFLSPYLVSAFQWRHIQEVTSHWRRGIPNCQRLHCSPKSLFGLTTKNTSRLHITGPLCGESTGYPVLSPHKGPVMWKAFPHHDVPVAHALNRVECESRFHLHSNKISWHVFYDDRHDLQWGIWGNRSHTDPTDTWHNNNVIITPKKM